MYQLKFVLQQHTPIIHFQYDQEGATLRGTELKPKLDKFIIEKMGGADICRIEHPEWFKNEHPALDYKIRIFGKGLATIVNLTPVSKEQDGNIKRNRQNKILVNKFPAFFGNDGKENVEEIRKGVLQNAELIISVFSISLRDCINAEISSFFLHHNFGLAQSKGFGSFTISAKSTLSNTYFFKPEYGDKDFYNLFFDIECFYKSIRSGLNIKKKDRQTGRLIDKAYFKSLMFKWAKSESEQWDKKTIREHFFSDHPLYRKQDVHGNDGVFENRPSSETVRVLFPKPEGGNYYNFRDLLGFSSEQNWGYYNKTIKKEMDGIDRFKSPLMFKPVFINNSWTVYLITAPIDQQYLNTEVFIKSQGKGDLPLSFPKYFNIDTYLKFAINAFDINDFVFSNGFSERNTPEAGILDRIYSELKSQLAND